MVSVMELTWMGLTWQERWATLFGDGDPAAMNATNIEAHALAKGLTLPGLK